MDLPTTLARIVPTTPDTHLVIAYGTTGNFTHKFFPADTGHLSAANLLRQVSAQGLQAYFAVAGFARASRKQADVAGIRALYIDADVSRPGDGKANAFPDRAAAWAWLAQFTQGTGLPLPNTTVDSGYGYHWYWVLDTVLDRSTWQGLADAFLAAMLAHGWVGDTNVTIDSARILRPPELLNHKVPEAPVPTSVVEHPKLPTDDHDLTLIENKLQPYRNPGAGATRPGTLSRVVKSPVASLGTPPAHITPGVSPGLNAGASANLGGLHEPHWFEEVSKRCLQAGRSLLAGGAGDPYPLWYLGWLTMLVFCEDGADFVHPISQGHVKYSQANVDSHFTKAQHEVTTKNIGPPTCGKIDMANPGLCQACPHWGSITSPVQLGYQSDPASDTELPDGYRQSPTAQQVEYQYATTKTVRWVKLIPGIVSNPWLEVIRGGGYRIHFTYSFGGEDKPVNASDVDLGTGGVEVARSLARLGITASKDQFVHIGAFLVAWINKLRNQRVISRDGLRPFGWTTDEQGKHLGFAVAGMHYLANGTEETVAAGDAMIAAYYRPTGEYAEWRKPGPLFETSEPAAQLIVATAFAAPLIALASVVKGVTWNFWSTSSGVRKTAAMEYAQSVWGDPVQKSSQSDTYNAIVNLLGTTRVLPRYWDDMRCEDKESQETFNALVHSITQGAEKNRLSSAAQLQTRREWETMLVISSNRSLSDLLSNNDVSDSGYQRLIQVKFEGQPTAYNAQVGMTLNLIKTNYGHAGRIYAKHIAGHHDEIQQEIVQAMEVLGQRFTIQQSERHFITAMACVLIGARHAEALGLFTFDHKGMLNCMRLSLGDLRSATGAQVLVNSTGAFDPVEVLHRYVHHEAARRIRTDIIYAPGGPKPHPIGPPTANNINVQIAERTGTLRINRVDFRKWMTSVNIPANQLVDQLAQIQGVRQTREHIGAGTVWATTKMWVLDIPLVGPFVSFIDGADAHPDPKIAKLFPVKRSV
jgi:hypothetical protein